jgi:hypothetical protein
MKRPMLMRMQWNMLLVILGLEADPQMKPMRQLSMLLLEMMGLEPCCSRNTERKQNNYDNKFAC